MKTIDIIDNLSFKQFHAKKLFLCLFFKIGYMTKYVGQLALPKTEGPWGLENSIIHLVSNTAMAL